MVAIKQQSFASIWKELVPPQLPLDVFYGLLWLVAWWSSFMLGGCLGMLLAKTDGVHFTQCHGYAMGSQGYVMAMPRQYHGLPRHATAMPWVAKALSQSASVHAQSRLADWLITVPHLIGAHRRPPSTSLQTISSTL
jgi:hypothetical protein